MIQPLHILILPAFYVEPDKPVHRGGLFREQAESLAAAGHRVGIAYVEQRELKTLSWQKIKENHFQISSTVEQSGLTTFRMHAWNPKVTTVLGGRIWSQMALQLVYRYIKENGRPDIIHAHFGIWAGYAASLISKKFSVPYIVTEHASSVALQTTSSNQLPYLKAAYNHAKFIVCVSDTLAEKVAKLTANRIEVLQNFIDTSCFRIRKNNISTEQFRIISVGNLTEVKNFTMLITAFHKAFGANGGAELTIVGDGVDRAKLENIVSKLGANIHFLGAQPPSEVAKLMAEHHVFALASNVETFGVVLIEAMAAGLPVVCTACGGPNKIVDATCGLLTPVADQSAMAQALTAVRKNYHTYDPQAIRQRVLDNYDASKTAQSLTSIYNKALEK